MGSTPRESAPLTLNARPSSSEMSQTIQTSPLLRLTTRTMPSTTTATPRPTGSMFGSTPDSQPSMLTTSRASTTELSLSCQTSTTPLSCHRLPRETSAHTTPSTTLPTLSEICSVMAAFPNI